MITNRPLSARAAFDRTRFEGDLPSGWEAEIYRNGELLAFAKANSSQRYVFEDVQLLYGENQIQIILYGPQGQVRTRDEVVNVGQDNVPAARPGTGPGSTSRDATSSSWKSHRTAQPSPRGRRPVSLEHGIDDKTSVGVLARAMLIGDERLTFIEGTVRRSIGPALVELGAAREFERWNGRPCPDPRQIRVGQRARRSPYRK